MRSALISGVLAAVLTSTGSAEPRNTLEVTAVRFWSLADSTRIAVEIDGEFRYRADRLSDPERLFFDLKETRPNLEGKRFNAIQVGDRLVKRVRVAEPQRGVTRIVLDLERDVEYTASQLRKPDRLVIEVRAKGSKGETPAFSPGPSVTRRERVTPDESSPTGETPRTRPDPAKPDAEPGKLAEPPRKFEPPVPVKHRETVAELPAPPAPMASRPPSTTAAKLLAPKVPGLAAPADTPRTAELPETASPRAARRTASGSNTMVRALGLKLGRVVLDPGHGGNDHGSTGPGGLMEKELVLDVARRLGALIEERMGAEVVYTRDDDTFVHLESRTEIANRQKADLFLSIHANSSPYASASGVEVYYLNFAASREALDLAARENAGATRGIHDLNDLLKKISLNDKLAESREFAQRVQTSLYSVAARSNPGVRNRGVKKAPFVVLIGASMPSVLAEIGFVSNSREESLLKRPEHRQKLAEALYRGLSRYAETLSHFQVARAKD